MERTAEDIKRLLERWYEADTTDAEERELREWFRTAESLPAELEGARRMFAGFEELRSEELRTEPFLLDPKSGCGSDFPSYSNRSMRLRRAAFWLSAAAVVAGIVLAAEYFSRPYAYINGRPVRDAETAMQATVYLEQLSAFDRSILPLENAIKPENKE